MNWTFLFEMTGTIAFAISGALTAADEKMDIFGVCMLGMTTAVGGGILKDIILGMTPPGAFRNPVYACTAIAVSLIVFLPSVRKSFRKAGTVFDPLRMFMDTIGLAVFTVAGISTSMAYAPTPNLFLSVFVGTLTGVGGGVLRDIMAGHTPMIFRTWFYASASIIGGICTVFLWRRIGNVNAMFIGSILIIFLRAMAIRYHWKLPRAE